MKFKLFRIAKWRKQLNALIHASAETELRDAATCKLWGEMEVVSQYSLTTPNLHPFKWRSGKGRDQRITTVLSVDLKAILELI